MHTVELLEQALQLASRLGYRVRQDWLDGRGGGDCEIAGQKWIFLDLAQGPIDHLELVLSTLRRDPQLAEVEVSGELKSAVERRRAA